MTDRSPLRAALDHVIAEYGGTLADYTIQSPQADPFRLDTPANHRDGKWLADAAQTLGLGSRKIHNRGLHYMILGQTKPDGSEYVNTGENWEWLDGKASRAARWLGYIPFDQITDQRNAAPVIRLWTPPQPQPLLGVGLDVEIPDAADLLPTVYAHDFTGSQPYKLVFVGEKSSLDTELGPIAEQYQADLFLPTGDISDTMVHQMARIGAADGRPMVVLYFADADPSGWNMGIVIARKLTAFKILRFPELKFQVHRVGLTPDQVRQLDLPSTPLKESERRAEKWRQAMGVEQTEIDALATLRPDLLRQITHEAVAPFYDATLERRVTLAAVEWQRRAQAIVDNSLDTETRERIYAEAAEQLAAMRAAIDNLNEQVRFDANEFSLPEMVIPVPQLNGYHPRPLLDSAWSFPQQCRALKASTAYELDGG